jgi:integrative and conjugative element protein (TIGR02256 family)
MKRQTFQTIDHRKLIITDNIVEKLFDYRQTEIEHREAGGLLIGRHLLEERHFVVDHITEPSWLDKRLPTFFFRSNRHNKILKKIWKKSDSTQTLIGLWHTHPEPVPTPSSVDYNDWKSTLRYGDFAGEHLFFMIVGTMKSSVWQGDRSSNFTKLIEIINTDRGVSTRD